MASGTSASQKIWVTYDGNPTTVALGSLYSAYYNGTLGRYRIYYTDPATFEVATVGIDEVINYKACMGVRLTSEDGRSVIVSATGGILDISEFGDPDIIVSNPSQTRYFVGAETDGRPGNKKLYVRDIVSREYVGMTCMAIPVPNMISDQFYVIVV